MKRFILALLLLVASLAVAATASTERIIGAVQPEIRLTDGTVFKDAKVLGVSLDRNTATLSDGRQIRIVTLDRLPEPLRTRVIDEARRNDAPRYNIYRDEVRPPPPADRVIVPSQPPAASAPTRTVTDDLVTQAVAEAADELRLHLLKRGERVSSLTTRVRQAGQVPGWPKIRVSGDAAYAIWDHSRRDYVWRTDKFEVDYAIVDGVSLKLDTVTFAGVSQQAEIDP
jgi:hypothetical protein